MGSEKIRLSLETAVFLAEREFGLADMEFEELADGEEQVFSTELGSYQITVWHDEMLLEGLLCLEINDDEMGSIERYFDPRTLEQVRSPRQVPVQGAGS